MAGAVRAEANSILRQAVGLGLALAGLGVVCVGQAERGGGGKAGDTFDLSPSLPVERASRPQLHEFDGGTRITLGPHGRDVRLAGELTEGAAARLAGVLALHPGVERIHLTSEGGLVDEGEAIGAQIAARGLVTYVPDYCVSACTLAFVRGRQRLILATSRLGFHAPYEAGPSGQDVRVDPTPERASYIAAGVSADFVDGALQVSPDDLWIPDADRLLAAGVATGVVDTSRFPDSTLDEGSDLPDARAALLRNFALLREIDGLAPRILDGIAGWYRAAYREGLSERTAVEGVKRLSARALVRLMQGADNATIVAYGHVLLAAMKRAQDVLAPDCARIASEGDLMLAQDVLAPTDAASVPALVARAAKQGWDALPDQGFMADDAPPPSQPVQDCAGGLRTYTQALALPEAAAAARLRGLVRPSAPHRTQEASARP